MFRIFTLFSSLIFLSITLLPLRSFSQELVSKQNASNSDIPHIEEICVNPLLDFIAFYEVDEAVLCGLLDFHKWKFVLISDPNNAPDKNHLGAVTAPFKIAKYEVTAKQYEIFLNAVAGLDPYQLFDLRMENDPAVACIRRTFNQALGRYEYTVLEGKEDLPITYVSWECGARFCNWLHNGYPSLSELEGQTIDEIINKGAYIFNSNGTVTLSHNALYFLPTENQWYKAGYYVHSSYFCGDDGMMDFNSPFNCQKDDFSYYLDYPTSDDGHKPGNTFGVFGDANYANYYQPDYCIFNLPGEVNYHQEVPSNPCRLTPVGSFGDGNHCLCDMGGNVNEWTSTPLSLTNPEIYLIRGGSWKSSLNELHRNAKRNALPKTDRNNTTGFRVAAVTTPLTPIAPAQTLEASMIANLKHENSMNLDALTTTMLLQPLLGPVEFLGSFVIHEALETFGVLVGDWIINECTRSAEKETATTTNSLLWRYWRVMAIPTAGDFYAGLSLGGTLGTINTIEVAGHAFIDTVALRTVDSFALEYKTEIAENVASIFETIFSEMDYKWDVNSDWLEETVEKFSSQISSQMNENITKEEIKKINSDIATEIASEIQNIASEYHVTITSCTKEDIKQQIISKITEETTTKIARKMAANMAARWGLKPLVDFYSGLMDCSESILTPLKYRLEQYRKSRGLPKAQHICMHNHESKNQKEITNSESLNRNFQSFQLSSNSPNQNP
ncbi:MAG: formylglycine-generating enzyme family protein [Chthoniobacterales bacterium]